VKSEDSGETTTVVSGPSNLARFSEGELQAQEASETTEHSPAAEVSAESTSLSAEPAPSETLDAVSVTETSTPTQGAATPEPEVPSEPARPLFGIGTKAAPVRKSVLKIVEAVAPPMRPMVKPQPSPIRPAGSVPAKPSIRGTQSKDKDGFTIIRMNKEHLDQMAEDETKRRTGRLEGEIRPEDVRFNDYRKKELVFLPKKKKIPVNRELKKTQITTPKAGKRVIEMGETITVADLASQLQVKAGEVIRKLVNMGQMVTVNQSIDMDTAMILASEYGYEVRNISFKEEAVLDQSTDAPDDLVSRPPVVTIMGHVDHGKTTLLDSIRSANVAGGEAGGITQHIGAYTVTRNGQDITFIDTPGHEAFTSMRARGANVTDIVILVVAADDAVMPQTREALSHAKAAGVPIIVAVNKMDKPGAAPDRVRQQLAELDLLAEDWGGQTMFVHVSALKKTGIDELLDAILLQSEVLELKANPHARAVGTVLEARLEKGRGPMASVLISRGTLSVGDPIVSGTCIGKVRALMDDQGKPVKKALPGYAVEVLGFETLPQGGDRFDAPLSESDAKDLISHRLDKARAEKAQGQKVSLEDLFARIQTGTTKELPLIIKADVFGSAEAVRDSVLKLANDQVKIKIILSAPGGITESDVLLATASKAIILGFNVRPETKARQLAEREHVEIKCYNIIYELIDDVRSSMTGLLDKKRVENYLGRAEVRQTFSVPKAGTIAGCSVVDGKVVRGANVRLLRDSRILWEGKMSSLRRFKDDAKEVAEGFECGIGLDGYNDLKVGDLIEAYQVDMVAGELHANTPASKGASAEAPSANA
jgi:translation initiation factor IF-2